MTNSMTEPITIIPARLGARRLPNKPLMALAGKPMIVHVWQKAVAADTGRVVVACDSQKIAEVITAEGGEAVLTPPELPSGSDRVAAALDVIDPEGKIDSVVNLQGDLPEVAPYLIKTLVSGLAVCDFPLLTLVTPLEKNQQTQAQVVKVAVAWQGGATPHVVSPNSTSASRESIGRALYFSRTPIPHGGVIYDKSQSPASSPPAYMWHHIGMYGWRRAALQEFVKTPPSSLEVSEGLEQLRVLEGGDPIGVIAVDSTPHGIDTEEDFNAANMRLTASH